jgi:hypothetical protein
MPTPRAIRIYVSDHALLRYIERRFDVPLHLIRKQIEQQAKPAATLGATLFGVEDVKFVLTKPDDNGVATVKTVLERWMRSDNREGRPTKKNHNGDRHGR